MKTRARRRQGSGYVGIPDQLAWTPAEDLTQGGQGHQGGEYAAVSNMIRGATGEFPVVLMKSDLSAAGGGLRLLLSHLLRLPGQPCELLLGFLLASPGREHFGLTHWSLLSMNFWIASLA